MSFFAFEVLLGNEMIEVTVMAQTREG